MGYVVLHLDKSPGNESVMTDHIERNVIHPNVDPNRIHLNKELIGFPEGVDNRTEAIQHRLKTAGLTRQVGKNQVPVIRFMLSGTPEDMERIQLEGKLDDWCRDNIDWLKKTYGDENVVAATLHMDETTPHIHASVVPIVRGERRQKATKKKQEQVEGKSKRKYKKKDSNRPRLCCDDVMAKTKLIEYQDSYAEAMKKFGLERGVKGSEARHITLTEFYRNQVIESQNLQTDIETLLAVEEAKRQSIEGLNQQEQEAMLKSIQAEEQKRQKESELKKTEESLNQVKGQLKAEKFKSSAAVAGSALMDGISSALGTTKVKRQQQEIEDMKSENTGLQTEIKTLKEQIQTNEREHIKVTDKLRQELDRIYSLFPKIKELLRIENLCRRLGFSESLTKAILEMKPVGFKGKLYSPEYQRFFETEHSVAEIKRHPTEKEKLQLTIDNVKDTNWFRQKYKEFQETIGIKVKKKSGIEKSKGFSL